MRHSRQAESEEGRIMASSILKILTTNRLFYFFGGGFFVQSMRLIYRSWLNWESNR